MMTPTDNMYYAAGEVAYAIAMADGQLQKEEKDRFQEILKREFNGKISEANTAEIIFKLFQKEKVSANYAYEAAMHTLNANSHYLSKAMKEHIIHVIEHVASSFPPVTQAEMDMISKFIIDVSKIKVDEVLSKGL